MTPFNSGPSLVVISDTGRTRQIPVPFDGIVLGRDAGLGPPFSTDEFVSRNHVSVQRRGDVVEIADLGSANGTYVNGTRVHASARLQDSGAKVAVVDVLVMRRRIHGANTMLQQRPGHGDYLAALRASVARKAAAKRSVGA